MIACAIVGMMPNDDDTPTPVEVPNSRRASERALSWRFEAVEMAKRLEILGYRAEGAKLRDVADAMRDWDNKHVDVLERMTVQRALFDQLGLANRLLSRDDHPEMLALALEGVGTLTAKRRADELRKFETHDGPEWNECVALARDILKVKKGASER